MKPIPFAPSLSLALIPLLVVSPLWGQTATASGSAASASAASASADEGSLQLRVIERDATEAKVNTVATKGFTVQVTNAAGVPVAEAAVAFRLPDSGATGVFADGNHASVVYTDATGTAYFPAVHWSGTAGSVPLRIVAAKGSSHAGVLLEETLLGGTPGSGAAAASAAANTAAAPAAPLPEPVTPPVPGQLPKAAVTAKSAVAPPPVAPAIVSATAPAIAAPPPSVTVTNAPGSGLQHGSHAKWLILAVVAAAAGAGVAVAGKGKSSSTAAAAPSLSIGTPSVSVGHP